MGTINGKLLAKDKTRLRIVLDSVACLYDRRNVNNSMISFETRVHELQVQVSV